MATAVELAVIEMQIVVREMNRRLGGIERRLGLEAEPIVPRGREMTPLAAREAAEVTRRAAERVDPYEMAERGGEGDKRATREMAEGWEAVRETPDVGSGHQPEAVAGEPAVLPQDQPTGASAPQAGRELPVMPPREPAAPPPSAARVMAFIESHVPAEKPRSTLETTLGVEVASWLAAFAIMGGILFFLKLQMDNGIVNMSDAFRVGLALLAGSAMIGHGIWLESRKMQAIAAALTGAGVATLMAGVLAAHVAFDEPVLSRGQAFVAMTLVGGLGIGLALRRRSVGLALLAFMGMYLSPWILSHGADHSWVFFVHLLLVTAGCLALAWKKKNWDHLRLLAFAASWLWLLGWASGDFAENNFDVGLIGIGVFFAIFLGDMVGNLWLATRQDAENQPQAEKAAYWDTIGAIFSWVNTALALVACALLFDKAHLTGLWFIALFLAGAMGVVYRVVRGEYLSRSAAIQALTLVVLSVPLYFDGVNATLAWAGLAIGFGLYGNWRNSEMARVYMFGTLVLAAGRHFAMDSVDVPLQADLFRLGGNGISTWMLAGWALSLLALLLAWLSRPVAPTLSGTATRLVGAAWATIGCIALSTIVVFVVNVRALSAADSFTLAAIVWSFALIALLRVRALAEIDTALESLVTVLLLLLSAKWFVYDGLTREINGMGAGAAPLWNGFTLNAVLLAAAILALNPLRKQPEIGRRFIAWWMTGLLFAFLNMQALWCVDYFVKGDIRGIGGPELFKNVALTLLWGLFASVMIGLGFGRKSPPVRYVGLTLLACTVGKILFVDMANVETILRVFSLIALGTLLFVVSYLYHKHIRELPARTAPAAAV